MAEEKLSFEQFLKAINEDYQAFIQDLHKYLINNGCKPTFEAKKSGPFASYKHAKSKKSIVNFLTRKNGMFVRIYGENVGKYPGFMNELPEEMVQSIKSAGICKRLAFDTCSPKCTGYDFTIENERYQKCRYGGFEFLITGESSPYIKLFVENEARERDAA